MVKNPEILRDFEDSFVKDEGRLSFERAMRLFSDMWHEGITLGVLPPIETLEGIEVDIRIAKALNSCLKKSSPA